MGVANAQNEVSMTVNTGSSGEFSLAEKPTILSYASTSVTPVGNAGFGGLAFYWGYMFPASMVEEYAGKYITQVAYLEGGGEDFAGDYSINLTSGTGTVVTKTLEKPVPIDGSQNIWVMLYQDGSVQGPAFVMDDMGDANSRWVGLPSYDMWLDVNQAQGGSGYSFILWAFVDDYDLIGETEDNITVFPNPTQNTVTVLAPGTNQISVLNTLGQVVYDAVAESDSLVLDMSQYKTGMYLIRVITENGIIVERVIVVK